ncbi:uncharacterized protein LOC105684821 [Athalia rosae]|uniref:uncharacterized protein LOC105684821 n=1 Tax=Athalia rosae TaxID=37344 RepID=UPI0020332559|nr:uncharacterized protein LOC105684821 [Athalia rosae]
MRLTAILLRKKLPNGHIFRGKNRLVKQVDEKSLKQLRWDYELEEQNMLFLRHPYLTVEQSYGHATAYGKPEKRMEGLKQLKIDKFSRTTTLKDRLMHLQTSETWD